ncbi:MAG: ABC transporter ATP-binding protein [Methanobacteriaceae archaeon]|jgi:ABC-2 type transport system ATP-binding protein|nr:ABC transporter ATP-binding protein [Candidatus Methanorudis spinitermitis]
MSVIKIENLTKDYGSHKGIFDVSFQIKEGEVFGFLGPNGAGKTTTIRHLMGFIKQNSGECYINDLNCFINASIIQENTGYIPGEIAFIDGMTGIKFIKFLADYRGLKDLTKAHELIERFDLDPKDNIKKMSKGTKQKLGIIVALMHDPKIIILDEPTSGLDPLMQNKFIELILEEKKKGKTILMSSHTFEEVEKTCDRVAIIKAGEIVVIDTIANLKKTKSKKFTITFHDKKEIPSFEKEGMEVVNVSNDKVTVLVKNNIKKFIKLINKYDIVDIDEEMQSLEDIFIEFYEGDKND